MELISEGRAFGEEFSWGGWKIRLVGVHADAWVDRMPYQQSIDDIDYIVEHTPHSHLIILGAGTQEPLGPQRSFADPSILGEFDMGHMGLEGRMFPNRASPLSLPFPTLLSRSLRHTCPVRDPTSH